MKALTAFLVLALAGPLYAHTLLDEITGRVPVAEQDQGAAARAREETDRQVQKNEDDWNRMISEIHRKKAEAAEKAKGSEIDNLRGRVEELEAEAEHPRHCRQDLWVGGGLAGTWDPCAGDTVTIYDNRGR